MFSTSNIERCLFKIFTACNQTRPKLPYGPTGYRIPSLPRLADRGSHRCPPLNSLLFPWRDVSLPCRGCARHRVSRTTAIRRSRHGFAAFGRPRDRGTTRKFPRFCTNTFLRTVAASILANSNAEFWMSTESYAASCCRRTNLTRLE